MISILLLRSLCMAILLMLPCPTHSQSYDGGDDYYSNEYSGEQQQQQDYSQDSLYHDYAARQYDKEAGGSSPSPMASWTTIAAAAGTGWVCGAAFHGRRLKKKLNAKHKNDQKELYQQYYNDVYALQQQNSELVAEFEKQYKGSARRK